MLTIQDVIPDQDQRDQIIADMIENAPNAKHPIGRDRYGREIYQLLYISPKRDSVTWVYKAKKPKRIKIKPWS